jgi:twitching motility two-component system response regulator PilH
MEQSAPVGVCQVNEGDKFMTCILIVDDSPTEMHVLKSMLEKNGYQTITATSGEQGVEVAKTEKPDLVLMDVVMPGLNGFQATRQLTKGTDTATIPVIICTTKDQETDRVWGMRQGAKDYVTKPVVEGDLIGKIKSALGG